MFKLIPSIMESAQARCKPTLISGLIASLLGIGISFIVNSTLAEISTSPFFALYFGILFIVLGFAITCRVYSQTVSDSRKKYFFLFGILIVLSGGLCFLLEKNWFVGLRPLVKIPLYGILGTSVSYALTFAVVDIVNYTVAHLKIYSRTVVESAEQVLGVIILAAIMGLTFGVIFGVMDYEDEEVYHKNLDLMKEEIYCYPIGAVCGFICGAMNEYLRKDYVKQIDTFEDEI